MNKLFVRLIVEIDLEHDAEAPALKTYDAQELADLAVEDTKRRFEALPQVKVELEDWWQLKW